MATFAGLEAYLICLFNVFLNFEFLVGLLLALAQLILFGSVFHLVSAEGGNCTVRHLVSTQGKYHISRTPKLN